MKTYLHVEFQWFRGFVQYNMRIAVPEPYQAGDTPSEVCCREWLGSTQNLKQHGRQPRL